MSCELLPDDASKLIAWHLCRLERPNWCQRRDGTHWPDRHDRIHGSQRPDWNHWRNGGERPDRRHRSAFTSLSALCMILDSGCSSSRIGFGACPKASCSCQEFTHSLAICMGSSCSSNPPDRRVTLESYMRRGYGCTPIRLLPSKPGLGRLACG